MIENPDLIETQQAFRSSAQIARIHATRLSMLTKNINTYQDALNNFDQLLFFLQQDEATLWKTTTFGNCVIFSQSPVSYDKVKTIQAQYDEVEKISQRPLGPTTVIIGDVTTLNDRYRLLGQKTVGSPAVCGGADCYINDTIVQNGQVRQLSTDRVYAHEPSHAFINRALHDRLSNDKHFFADFSFPVFNNIYPSTQSPSKTPPHIPSYHLSTFHEAFAGPKPAKWQDIIQINPGIEIDPSPLELGVPFWEWYKNESIRLETSQNPNDFFRSPISAHFYEYIETNFPNLEKKQKLFDAYYCEFAKVYPIHLY